MNFNLLTCIIISTLWAQISAEAVTSIAAALAGIATALGIGCRFMECCTERWIPNNFTGLNLYVPQWNIQVSVNPLPEDKILNRFKLKRSAGNKSKGEIARYEQFLLFSQCFQKACFQGVSKGVIEWEWVKRS